MCVIAWEKANFRQEIWSSHIRVGGFLLPNCKRTNRFLVHLTEACSGPNRDIGKPCPFGALFVMHYTRRVWLRLISGNQISARASQMIYCLLGLYVSILNNLAHAGRLLIVHTQQLFDVGNDTFWRDITYQFTKMREQALVSSQNFLFIIILFYFYFFISVLYSLCILLVLFEPPVPCLKSRNRIWKKKMFPWPNSLVYYLSVNEYIRNAVPIPK